MKIFIILMETGLLIYLYMANAKAFDKEILNDLKAYKFWWIISPGIGYPIFKKVSKALKNSSRVRNIKSRYNELFAVKGSLYYKVSRSGQITMLLFLLLLLEIIFFYVKSDALSLLFYLGIIAAAVILPDKRIEALCVERRHSIEILMPEFLSRLAVLMDAGMTVKTALFRIINTSGDNVLTSEMKELMKDLEVGKGDSHSFECFAQRCNTPVAASFASVIIQNLKKGNRELSSILRVFAGTSWTARKNNARKRGEEAAAKLIIPMMIIFLAIMILMAAPALMKMSI